MDPPVKPWDDKNWEKELEELSELENYRIRKDPMIPVVPIVL